MQSRTIPFFLLALLLLGGASPQLIYAQDGPTYATPEVREIVEKMIAAHGGMDPWLNAESFSVTFTMWLQSLPVEEGKRNYFNNWRVYKTTVDPRTSRAYVEIPLHTDGSYDGPSTAFDGERIWVRDYRFGPQFNDGPVGLFWFHYGMITLPWLSQVAPGATLELEGRQQLPFHSKDHYVVRLSFNAEGIIHPGLFRLYIDPDTYLMRGMEGTATSPTLPGAPFPEYQGGQEFNGIIRIMDAYKEVDGLMLPISYTTIRENEEGGVDVLGAHIVLDPSFKRPFDENQLRLPDGARILYPPPEQEGNE